jgi:hypothetical protein
MEPEIGHIAVALIGLTVQKALRSAAFSAAPQQQERERELLFSRARTLLPWVERDPTKKGTLRRRRRTASGPERYSPMRGSVRTMPRPGHRQASSRASGWAGALS